MINRGYPAVQEAAIEYEGNRVSRIVDSSSPAMAVYAPRFAEGEYDRPIAYDQCGRITADRTRRIASISTTTVTCRYASRWTTATH